MITIMQRIRRADFPHTVLVDTYSISTTGRDYRHQTEVKRSWLNDETANVDAYLADLRNYVEGIVRGRMP